MRDLRDLSKLPAEPEYWERLEAQMREAVGAVKAVKAVGPGWWAPFARHAAVLGGLAVAAGIAALLLVPPRSRGGGTNPTVLFRLPDDPTMAAFLSSPTPPSWAAMMASLPRSEP
jgi:hypothetical protein